MRNQGFQRTPVTPVFQFPVTELDQTLGKFGFRPVSIDEIQCFHSLADELIEGEIAGVETLMRVQSWSRRALHWRTGDPKNAAILASIPLTPAGVSALLSGAFGFANAQRDWVCSPRERAAGLLSWGMAGRSASAQAASVRALLAGWHDFYGDVRVYARARSEAGARLLGRLEFVPLASADSSTSLYASRGIPSHLDRFLSRNSPQNTLEPLI
jgi:hypothetical protein